MWPYVRLPLEATPVLRAGDLLLEDQGFIDGATVSDLKRRRQVDVIIPSKPTCWPRRRPFNWPRGRISGPHIPLGLLSTLPSYAVWSICGTSAVPLNACVIRFWNKKKKRLIILSW